MSVRTSHTGLSDFLGTCACPLLEKGKAGENFGTFKGQKKLEGRIKGAVCECATPAFALEDFAESIARKETDPK